MGGGGVCDAAGQCHSLILPGCLLWQVGLWKSLCGLEVTIDHGQFPGACNLLHLLSSKHCVSEDG